MVCRVTKATFHPTRTRVKPLTQASGRYICSKSKRTQINFSRFFILPLLDIDNINLETLFTANVTLTLSNMKHIRKNNLWQFEVRNGGSMGGI